MIDELCEEFGLGNKQENRKPHTLKRNRKSACFVQILSSRLVSFSFLPTAALKGSKCLPFWLLPGVMFNTFKDI